MPTLKYFTSKLYWYDVVGDSPAEIGGDVDTDPDTKGINGAVTITPSVRGVDLRAIKAPGLTPNPAVFALAPIEARIDDGRLKMTASQVDVRLVANCPVLELPEDAVLVYEFRPHHVTYNKGPQTLPTITIVAPEVSDDSTVVVDLAQVEWLQQGAGLGGVTYVRQVPDGVELTDGDEVQFTAQGVPVGDPLALNVTGVPGGMDDITDAKAAGKAVARSETEAQARSAINAASVTEVEAKYTKPSDGIPLAHLRQPEFNTYVATEVTDAVAADGTVVAAAEAAIEAVVETYEGVLPVATDGTPHPLVETDAAGALISRFVDAAGHTWVKLHEGVALPGGQLTAASVTTDKLAPTVPMLTPSSDDRVFTVLDEGGRTSEMSLDANGRFPQWVVDAFVGRASATALATTRRRYTLKLDGAGDFTTLAAAVTALSVGTARSPIELLIHPGKHTAYQVNIPDWWILRGTNKLTCIIHGENADDANDTAISSNSTLQVTANHELHNLTITARNMRYPIHDETSGAVTDGKITVKNCHIEHLGNQGARDWRDANPGSGMLASTVSTIENPWGYGTSSGNVRRFVDTTFIGRATAWAMHDNKDFSLPSEQDFENCEIATTQATGFLNIQSLGAGQWSRISMRGTSISALRVHYSDSPFLSLADDRQLAEHSQIEVSIDGLDPIGFSTTSRGQAIRIESASTSTVSTVRVSGTGAAAIFGAPTVRDGGGGLKGYCFGQWDISGILAGSAEDTAVKNTLGRRLGDCSTVNKTLTITIDGGAPINVVFSTNLTTETNANILSAINTALGSAASATEYLVTRGETYPRFTSRTKLLVNRSATGISRWSAVKLSTTRGVELLGTSDAAGLFYGVALEPIPPNAIGRILTSGLLRTGGVTGESQMAGLNELPAAGTTIYHSDSLAGQFSLTGTRVAALVSQANWATFTGHP